MSYLLTGEPNAVGLFPKNGQHITSADQLPTNRFNCPMIVVSTTVVDPVNSQSLDPNTYYWNGGLNLWALFNAGFPGSGTVTAVGVGNGLWVNDTSEGTINISGNIGLAQIGSNTLLSNITSGDDIPRANTLTSILDAIIGNNVGSLIMRTNSGDWEEFPPGPAGFFLKSNGNTGSSELTWDNVPDVSSWSNYEALNSVFMDGHGIYGGDQSGNQTSLAITLLDIGSGSADGQYLQIGGGSNHGTGLPASLYIASFDTDRSDIRGGSTALTGGSSTASSNSIGSLSLTYGQILLHTTDDPSAGSSIFIQISDGARFNNILAIGTGSGPGSSCPVIYIEPDITGYVLTSNGPDDPATFQPNVADCSLWSTFPAVSDVSLAGFNIAAPDSDTAMPLTIRLPNLTALSTDNSGILQFGGDLNSGSGTPSRTRISSGNTTRNDIRGGSFIIDTGISEASAEVQKGHFQLNCGYFSIATYDSDTPKINLTTGISPTMNPSVAYSLLSCTDIYGGNNTDITFISPDIEGYVLTCHGPGAPATFEPIPGSDLKKGSYAFLTTDWVLVGSDYVYTLDTSSDFSQISSVLVLQDQTLDSPDGNFKLIPDFSYTPPTLNSSGILIISVPSIDLIFSGSIRIVGSLP